MAKSFLLSLSLCLLFLLHSSVAQEEHNPQRRGESVCDIRNLEALEPQNRVQAEAGLTEVWDHNNQQLRCAGVTLVRHTIQPRGLLLPSFTNTPQLIYIVQGRGMQGTLIPGCPETYQSEQGGQQWESERGYRGQEGQEESQRTQDRHQKIRHFRAGDIIALPAGVAHWAYNDGEQDLIAVIMMDVNNNANQLDANPRRFYLAGNPQQEHEQQWQRQSRRQEGQEGSRRGQESSGTNIFSGLSTRILAEVFGVNEDIARRIQSQRDQRGNIVRVENGLSVIRPPLMTEEQRERQEGRSQSEGRRWGGRSDNGLEETICSMRLRENIDDPSRADIYTPRGGRVSTINSFNLPILRWLDLSAERGVLYKNGIAAPHYHMNANSLLYVTRGRGRMQVVNDNGETVFDGELREGQLLVEPQNFAIAKQASEEGFEYIAFKTKDNSMTVKLAGRDSVIRAMPVGVLANAYQISNEDARRLKFNREETTVFRGSRSSEGRRADA